MSADPGRTLWLRAREVLDAVLDLPAAERARALARECGGDEALRREVEALVAADASAGDFLAAPALERAGGLLDGVVASAEPGEPGTFPAVPGYRLLRQIGEGGMGEVYLAERADGHFDRRLALKLLRSAGAAPDLRRRFERERQILARLEHPGIARLLDGGAAADGTPFLALEYVEGEPITSYCDARALPVEGRLALFVATCAAVQYAHGRLVVHRDLKPSNILVDTEGRPRLLDFGIAKLLDEESSGETALTRTHVRPMTPEYASPEQVRGEPVTTATDVHALGVLLFQLLTGHRPWAGGTRDAVLHAVLTVDAPAPSAVATGDAALLRRLRGDLDAIVGKALRKEPERRYASAEALARDVERHLSGHAVSARADTRFYRVGRVLRRHRAAFAGAAFALVALVGGLGVALVQGRRASLEAQRAEAVQSFLLSLFAASDPDESKGADLTARELLRRGERRIEAELAGQPEAQARLWSEIATVYLKLGEPARAEPLARRAAEAAARLHGPRSAEATAARGLLANALLDAGRIEAAEAEYRSALVDEEAARGDATATAALLHGGIAGARRQLGDPAGAVAEHQRALAIWERLGRAGSAEASDTLNDLSVALSDAGRYREAEDAARRAAAIRLRVSGEASAATLVALYSQANALYELGRWSEADAIFRRVLPVQERMLGPEHPKVLLTRRQVARLAGLLGRYDEAARELETIAARQGVASGSAEAGYTLEQLASLRLLQGDLVDAERAGRAAVRIFEARFGEGNADLAWARSTLAEVLIDAGRLEDAARLLVKADAVQHAGEADDDFHARTEVTLGLLALRRGRVDEARSRLEAGLAVHRKNGRAQSIARAATLLGEALAVADPGRAEALLREGLEIARRSLPAGHPDVASAQLALGSFLLDGGRVSEARPLLQEAAATRTARFGETSPRTVQARSRLAASTGGSFPAHPGS